LLGNALGMTGDLNDFLTKLYRRHGPIFRIRVPGRRIVVLAGQEGNSFVLRHARTHLRTNREFSELCRVMETDRAIISMDGADHVRLRRVAQAGYSREVIERDIDQAIEIAQRHVTAWPMQITTEEDAERQEPVLRVIAETELHERIYQASGDWQLTQPLSES